MRGVLHRIGEDLEEHAWYAELVSETVADVISYVACWAAFQDFVAAEDDD